MPTTFRSNRQLSQPSRAGVDFFPAPSRRSSLRAGAPGRPCIGGMGIRAGKAASRPDAGCGPGALRRDESAGAGSCASDVASAAASSVDGGAPATLPPGLRLVEGVLDAAAHDRVVVWIRATLDAGRAGALPGNTYAPIPDKWRARNQSREMLQFGTYTHSNRVETHVPVAPMPPELDAVVDALVRAGAVAPDRRPDSCTVNVYAPGQWIPPHIDNPAFERPFVTVSLCSRQTATFGRGMVWPEGADPARARGARRGEEHAVTLPVGSALVLDGDAADVYEHAVPPVTSERVSLTFRRVASPDDPRAAARAKIAEAARAAYRDRRRGPRRGYGPVGPAGAIGRVGPAPETEASRNREAAAAAEAAATARLTAATAPPAPDAHVSKSQRKKEARKAARAVAKAAARARAAADAEVPANPGTESTTTTSADGVTELERKAKRRPCPPCPRELLPLDAQEEKHVDVVDESSVTTGARAPPEALPRVERDNVREVYDAVARQWHGTRYRAWSGVEDFARRCVTDGSLVADVGCGNGKNAPIVASRGGFAVGCDFSAGLLDICAEERGLEVFAADATCLPVRSGTFDVALNIAVLHHVSSHRRRVALVSETMRLLRVGGAALFYAWALEQDVGGVSGHQFDAQDVLVPFHKRPVREAGGKKTDGTPKGPKGPKGPKEPDAGGSETVRSRDAGGGEEGAKVYQRYCHVYREGELPALFERLKGWVRVDRTYYDCGNWCVEATRTA